MTRALGKTGILTARETWEHEWGDRKGSQKENELECRQATNRGCNT